ncbi:MAG UNVERIFIED_CONTAM: flagellar basal body L-ring protein FlgH [Rickettsiaceae bacterium]|jgi:flagellar L-ring protein precursor FlgH
MSQYIKIFSTILLCLLLSSCESTVERLKRVGKAPDFAKLEVPIDETQLTQEQKEELSHNHVKRTNSLWQPGATSFFRDNRAWRVGDILRVVVRITDKATLANSTKQNRGSADQSTIGELFGRKKAVMKTLTLAPDATELLNTSGTRKVEGSGNINRQETIQTEVAVLVRQVLPNGNLIIEGHQEVRVNHELREIKVAGIIRPKDIGSDNSIKSEQIAEARISYGGRGVVSDMQSPRVGSQIADIISPF